MAASIPDMIGNYKVKEEIGRGGMGVVYRAFHPTLKRDVVIKKLMLRGKDKASLRERFKREAQILLELNNLYIVHMFDYFVEGTTHYIVMEYVDGMALDRLLKMRHTIPAPLALLILHDVCLALKATHAKGIVHRDIKPANILLSRKGEIKLTDFGIARTEDAADEQLTATGMTIGTPSYMPPEQIDGSKDVDHRADIYSVGAMLYEIVTGSRPFIGGTVPETLIKIHQGKYTPAEKIDKTLPYSVRRLIHKALQTDPDKRFQHVTQMLRIIKRYLIRYDIRELRTALVRAIADSSYEFPVFELKNKRAMMIGAAAICAAAAVYGCWALWTGGIIHKYLLWMWYSPLSVTMRLPDGASNTADLPLTAFFFVNDGKDIPEIPNSRREFVPAPDGGDGARLFVTEPVYLKPGEYRIKVVAGPYVWWQSVPLQKPGAIASVDFQQYGSNRLDIQAYASDASTGLDITASTSFFVWYGDKWVPLRQVPANRLTTGQVWKIRAYANGYQSEVFSLRIDWYQDRLFINASLKPEV